MLTPSDFWEWLRAVGVTWATGTIGQWVSSGLIEAPYLAPGRPKDEARYSLQAVGEACALFAFFKSVGRHHPKEKTKLAMDFIRDQFRGPYWGDDHMVKMKAPRLMRREPTEGNWADVTEMNQRLIGGDSMTHSGALVALAAYWKALAKLPIFEPREIYLMWTGPSPREECSSDTAFFRGALLLDPSHEDTIVIDLGAAKIETFFKIGIGMKSRFVLYPLEGEPLGKTKGDIKRLHDFIYSEPAPKQNQPKIQEAKK